MNIYWQVFIITLFFSSEIIAESNNAEQLHPGEAPYMEHCASCHDKGVYKTPSRMFLGMIGPENILKSLNDGTMTEYATDIEPEQRRAIAEYVAGRSLSDGAAPKAPPPCDEQHGFDASQTPVSLGWGNDLNNSRFQTAEAGGLTIDDVPGLEVKWAFAYPNTAQARSQPTVAGGAVYFGSQDGTVRALDAKTADSVETGAVIKADAYGLGVAPVGKALQQAGAKTFFVALASEGVALRQAIGPDARIFVFSGYMQGDEVAFGEFNLIPLLNSADQVMRFLADCQGAACGLQLDSGMNRLGNPGDTNNYYGDGGGTWA